MSEKREEFLRPLNSLEQQIVDYIEPILALEGTELVSIRISGLKGKPSLSLFIDKSSLDELASLSRLISDALDVANAEHNWFPRSYFLELSSPGLDRPLTKKSHFLKALGKLIRVKALAGTLRGVLTETTDSGIRIEGHPDLISWPEIRDANIIHVWR
jgi:ribosome maturation factor RimP